MQSPFQKEIIINGIDISKYREHPRVLELRIIMIFNALATHYDNNIAMTLMRNLSDVFYSNWTLISGILNNWAVIRRMERQIKQDIVKKLSLWDLCLENLDTILPILTWPI